MIKNYSFLLFFIFSNISNAQSIKIIVKDSLNQNLVSTAFALKENGQFLAKADDNGQLVFETNETKILVGAKNYKNIIYDLTTNKNNICKLPKRPEELLEVLIRGKQKTIGYGNLNLNKSNLSHVNASKIENTVCATKIDLKKTSTIAFYNFRVETSQANNSPFGFQIYNCKDGKPNQVIYNQIVENYKRGLNRVEIQDANFRLNSGEYFIAMQWIPQLDNSDDWVFGKIKGEKLINYGQSFSVNEGEGLNDINCRFFDNKWHPNLGKNKSFVQYIEVYED